MFWVVTVREGKYKSNPVRRIEIILQICRIADGINILYTIEHRCMPMMTYEPFWQMMNERKISTYSLEVDYGFNKAFINRLKHNKNMTLSSIDYICDIFSCPIEDVVVHTQNDGNSEKICLQCRDD